MLVDCRRRLGVRGDEGIANWGLALWTLDGASIVRMSPTPAKI